MLRYLRRLSARDYALDRGMIPLGSCTMKLNATTEMEPISLPGFADLHPFAPAEDAAGYRELIDRARGLAGRGHRLRPRCRSSPTPARRASWPACWRSAPTTVASGDDARDVCLIPSSAHGTNAASAVMAGMRVVVVKAADDGSGRPRRPAREVREARARTSPRSWSPTRRRTASTRTASPSCAGSCTSTAARCTSTARTSTRCSGYAKPGEFGGDVSHLNLHKTFCIPHGGGGPGVGPVAVRAHLAPYLPDHPLHPDADQARGHRADQRGAVRLGGHPADLVGLHADDGRRGADPGHRGRGAVGQLRREAARRALPGALQGARRPGRPRVHPRPARADQGDRASASTTSPSG